ncbi:MAG TPA: LLM class flavin-dependent oxidoreductase [Candidatus Bathyarchaeota archaeon]|nr:LLM class flavin-dependent oxidoreductase [Candidatus Bathyarchaeota archaeon]
MTTTSYRDIPFTSTLSSFARVVRCAKECERLGYDGVLIYEHLILW